MKETHQRQFKGVWIRAEIWENRELSWLEKCLLAEIDCLDNPQNGCTASNEYLAEMFGSTTASIANMISKLRRMGFVENVAFDGRRRTMRLKSPLTAPLTPDELPLEPAINSAVNAEAPSYKGERIGKKIEENDALSASPKKRVEPSGPKPLSEEDEKKQAKENHKQFIALWVDAFLVNFGLAYRFDGGKDAKAVKMLLATNKSPGELIDIAKRCWNRKEFPFSSAVTIAGFNSQFNAINVRLRTLSSSGRKIESREVGLDISVPTI